MNTAVAIEPRPDWSQACRIWPAVGLPDYPRGDLCTTAYHEAGHAVLCKAFGIAVDVAEIEPNGAGRVKPTRTRQSSDVDEVSDAQMQRATLQVATMFVGGIMAELILHGRDVDGVVSLEGFPDFDNARYLIWDAYRATGPMYYCQRMARALLTERWSQVERLAEVLLDNGRVNGDELVDILRSVQEKTA